MNTPGSNKPNKAISQKSSASGKYAKNVQGGPGVRNLKQLPSYKTIDATNPSKATIPVPITIVRHPLFMAAARRSDSWLGFICVLPVQYQPDLTRTRPPIRASALPNDADYSTTSIH